MGWFVQVFVEPTSPFVSWGALNTFVVDLKDGEVDVRGE